MRKATFLILNPRVWLLAITLIGPCHSAPAAQPVVDLGHVELQINIDEVIANPSRIDRWTKWLETSIASVESIGMPYPMDRLDIHLTSAAGNDPVQFGRVRRTAIPQIHLYLNPDASLDDLLDDWHSYHEFAHLLIPFPGNRDIWFTEGLASYYQYLLQARAGVISADQAWQRLADGFQRGLNDPNGRGTSLEQLSPAMWKRHAYRRVYWTGAAFFLRVDLGLRTESNGQYSLDQVLVDFNQCCRQERSRWNARQLVEVFGRLSLPAIWQQEYETSLQSAAQPEFSGAFERLGIEPDQPPTRWSQQHGAVALRDAIALANQPAER